MELQELKLTDKEKYMLSQINKVLEIALPTEEDDFDIIYLRNRGGYVYATGY